MKTTYHYVVLRLVADQLRGEVINVGIVLLSQTAPPRVIMMATLNKLRALDASWNSQRLSAWSDNVNAILQRYNTAAVCIQALARFGFCESGSVGSFEADNATDLAHKITEIKSTYVANRAAKIESKTRAPRKAKLQRALRDQFIKMNVMGESAQDVAMHLVVENMPVPECPDLKTDFIYKNGVYRITQTLDYRVSPDALHQKLTEACVKSTAVELASQHYGPDTKRLAVVDIPQELLGATGTHMDLLLLQGFEIFHFNDEAQMAQYYLQATPKASDLYKH